MMAKKVFDRQEKHARGAFYAMADAFQQMKECQ